MRGRRLRFTLPRQPRPRGDSDPEGVIPIPMRRRRVRFTLSRQSRPEGDSRESVGEHPHVRKHF